MFNQATIDNLTLEEKIRYGFLPQMCIYELDERVRELIQEEKDELENSIDDLSAVVTELKTSVKELTDQVNNLNEKTVTVPVPTEQSVKEKERIIAIADKDGEFITDVDGFTYWQLKRSGFLSAHHLRWIAEELDKRNVEINAMIDAYFKEVPLPTA